MSNRRRHTEAQRIWRRIRKLSTAELWSTHRQLPNGKEIILWRPAEKGWRLKGFRRSPVRFLGPRVMPVIEYFDVRARDRD